MARIRLVSVTAYAAHRKARGLSGGTSAGVRKAIRTGRISLTDGGLIHPATADRQWFENTRFKSDLPSGAYTPPARPNGAPMSLNDARAKRESFLAHLAELEFQREAAKLVSAESVEQAINRQSAVLHRHLVVALPGRMVPVLLAMTDPGEIEVFMQEQIRSALENVIAELENDEAQIPHP